MQNDPSQPGLDSAENRYQICGKLPTRLAEKGHSKEKSEWKWKQRWLIENRGFICTPAPRWSRPRVDLQHLRGWQEISHAVHTQFIENSKREVNLHHQIESIMTWSLMSVLLFHHLAISQEKLKNVEAFSMENTWKHSQRHDDDDDDDDDDGDVHCIQKADHLHLSTNQVHRKHHTGCKAACDAAEIIYVSGLKGMAGRWSLIFKELQYKTR